MVCNRLFYCSYAVPGAGIEPACTCVRWILSPALMLYIKHKNSSPFGSFQNWYKIP